MKEKLGRLYDLMGGGGGMQTVYVRVAGDSYIFIRIKYRNKYRPNRRLTYVFLTMCVCDYMVQMEGSQLRWW